MMKFRQVEVNLTLRNIFQLSLQLFNLLFYESNGTIQVEM